MPYRRLPNTDKARLRALEIAIEKASNADFSEQVIPYKLLNEAQRFYALFKTKITQKYDNFETKVSANKQYRHEMQKARMYISHFIQVLNMSVIRGEIKKSQKELYGLDPDLHIVPELTTDQDILAWGERIINGENKRIAQGGYPIYNPNITKVRVYYDIFREHLETHQFHANTSSRLTENVDAMRAQADKIIIEIWNTVEDYYKNLLPYARMQHCKAYGLIFYYRTGETKLSKESDQKMQTAIRSQTTLQWS